MRRTAELGNCGGMKNVLLFVPVQDQPRSALHKRTLVDKRLLASIVWTEEREARRRRCFAVISTSNMHKARTSFNNAFR